MVYFYNCTAFGEGKTVTIYAGKEKTKILYVMRYRREAIPKSVLDDAAQLVKAGSIQRNKKDNITVIYTPASNLLKTVEMDVGTVSFKNDRLVRRVYVAEHINAIVNRLNKTRVERVVDHEAEKIEREQTEAKERRLESNERRNRELELSRLRKAESESRDYSRLHETKAALSYEEEEAEWNSRQKDGEFDPDEDFM